MLRKRRKTLHADLDSSWLQAPLQPSQAEIRRQRQNSGGNGSGQNELIVHHSEAAKDELAEASGANRGSNGGQAYRDDDGHSHAGENHTQRQRQLHLK